MLGVKQARADGRERNVERLGDLVVRQPFDLDQNEHGALRRRQLPERAIEDGNLRSAPLD